MSDHHRFRRDGLIALPVIALFLLALAALPPFWLGVLSIFLFGGVFAWMLGAAGDLGDAQARRALDRRGRVQEAEARESVKPLGNVEKIR